MSKSCKIVKILVLLFRHAGGSPVPPETSVPLLQELDLTSLPESDRHVLCLPFSHPHCTSSAIVGGKGCQLAQLSKMKSKVCLWVTVDRLLNASRK